MKIKLTLIAATFLFSISINTSHAQEHSVARQWNEMLLEAIRADFARPTVHARNLFHTSVAMYDAWAVYDSTAKTYLLGNTIDDFSCPYDPELLPELSQEILDTAQHVAISYAAYRLLKHRFEDAPDDDILDRIDAFMADTLGYLIGYTNADYTNGSPAAMGNYIAQCIIDYGFQDGANEQGAYENLYYEPVNDPLVVDLPGNPDILDPNSWQPLTLESFIDQSGNPIDGNTPPFLSPEWGLVEPFALQSDDLNIYERDGNDYWVYHDPGVPPYLDFDNPDALTEEYQWGFMLVALWSSHLTPDDGLMWDISPASIGNFDAADFPTDIAGLQDFYNLIDGSDPSSGHDLNPATGLPYEPNMVPRGDYTRVLAEFWADGPDSETPPGHWYTILNYVSDHPELEKRFRGAGPVLEDLEWDVKSYLTLGGAMHDVAITAWGIKGYYDYIRPISAIRLMADNGQSSDPELPSYHPEGIPLVPGYVELVEPNTPMAGFGNVHAGKIQLYAWRGPDFISDPETDDAGVGWILAENWWPYQRPSFVTPPFAGYISGHSTYSRAAAEVLTLFTGSNFFPGGMGVFSIEENEFLVFEEGPSQSFDLQWATYQDASDQCSLSRIWGGIHPPADDIPGRLIGLEVGIDAFLKAETYFYTDNDMDGFLSNVDCDDENPNISPDAIEICDGIDNDCNGLIDDNITVFTYFQDMDGDGFGTNALSLDTCATSPPDGFADNTMDCDDSNPEINPDAPEICDNLDNNCNTLINDGLESFTFYRDVDGDGFGDAAQAVDTCLSSVPVGYATLPGDCDDDNPEINPDAIEVCDGIDNNCDGIINEGLDQFTYYLDNDNDGYGDPENKVDTCLADVLPGYTLNDEDCDDDNPEINPDGTEIPNNGIDEDCDDEDLINATSEARDYGISIYPNPTNDLLYIQSDRINIKSVALFHANGKLALSKILSASDKQNELDMSQLPSGVYFLRLHNEERGEIWVDKIIKW